jgi:hypothetical protein
LALSDRGKGSECCFKGVEKTPSEDGIVRITHIHHIEGYILNVSIGKAAERY